MASGTNCTLNNQSNIAGGSIGIVSYLIQLIIYAKLLHKIFNLEIHHSKLFLKGIMFLAAAFFLLIQCIIVLFQHQCTGQKLNLNSFSIIGLTIEMLANWSFGFDYSVMLHELRKLYLREDAAKIRKKKYCYQIAFNSVLFVILILSFGLTRFFEPFQDWLQGTYFNTTLAYAITLLLEAFMILTAVYRLKKSLQANYKDLEFRNIQFSIHALTLLTSLVFQVLILVALIFADQGFLLIVMALSDLILNSFNAYLINSFVRPIDSDGSSRGSRSSNNVVQLLSLIKGKKIARQVLETTSGRLVFSEQNEISQN